MNVHPPQPAGPTLTARPRHRCRLPVLAAGCAGLILAALAVGPVPAAAAEPGAGKTETSQSKSKSKAEASKSKSKSKSKTEAGKGKPAAEPVKPKTTEAAKRKPRRTSVGQVTNPVPAVPPLMVPDATQRESGARAVAFESGPGVLGVSLRTARQQQIKDYVTEPVANVALAFDDLRLAPVNKGDHIEVNLGERIRFDGRGDKVAPKSRRVLDVVARILTDNPETRVGVQVHTDDADSTAENLRQSQRGADAVRQSLMSKGIAAERITALGRGSADPLSNKRADRFRNKRVELHIAPLTPPAAPAAAGGAAAPPVTATTATPAPVSQ